MGKKRVKDDALACERPDRSAETISLSVKYMQLIGAHDGGFLADPTDDCEFASAGHHLGKAHKLLSKLVGLSPHGVGGASPLSQEEVRAKVAVARALYGFRRGEELDDDERMFLRFLLGEVADFFNAAQQVSQRGKAST
ncbi:hypothetical protein [Bradyrhizobium sp. I1.7.5]|uniref:hypothetical protein n=1 Tax=Bradyrhizobium sp. I1.7.5 TaxID=3156363 RepID=UPI00339AB704